MPSSTLTLKLPFLDLNTVKKQLFAEFQQLNTELANSLLKLTKKERKGLTTAKLDTPLASYWLNQTLRNCNAETKVKQFKSLALESNNQAYKLHKNGETYSVSFNITKDRKNRVPIKVHQAKHQSILDKIISGEAKQGSIKLVCSKKGIWYACISVTLDVPEVSNTEKSLGVDRGLNCIAVAVTQEGKNKFFKAGHVKNIRRRYQKLRKVLQSNGKHKTVKRIEQKESRIMRHVNHCISKEIVAFAVENECKINLEDLTGIRKSAKQRKKTKSNASKNLDSWSYYDLEQKIIYKAALAGIIVEKRPPQYTSQTCSKCGHINKRNKHTYHCSNCYYSCHADWNAGMNLANYDGMTCALELDVLKCGVHGTPLNLVNQNSLAVGNGENKNLHPIANA